MFRTRAVTAILGGMLVMAGCAMVASNPVKYSGGVMVSSAGMTLYTFDKDLAGSGKSACIDQCTVAWPPLKATADDKPGGDYTLITRDDGSKQWAYKGKPLHLWIKDRKPGDKTGDGFDKLWHVVKEAPPPMWSGY